MGGWGAHSEASRNIIQSGLFTGSIEVVEFGSITAMYGGLHCSTQVKHQRAQRPWKATWNTQRDVCEARLRSVRRTLQVHSRTHVPQRLKCFISR